MKVLYSTHDELFEPHFCPECELYWVFCNLCGLIIQDYKEDKNGDKYIKCLCCHEPFWVNDAKEEKCPACVVWDSLGKYKEWIVEE